MIIYNLKKLTEDERYERYSIIRKFIEQDPFFEELTSLTNPTNNHKKYPNRDLAKIFQAFTERLPEGGEGERLRQLYSDFCREYVENRERTMIQMGHVPHRLLQGVAENSQPPEEHIELPAYERRTSSYQERYRDYREEEFNDEIEFDTLEQFEEFMAFSDKFGLKIKARNNQQAIVQQKAQDSESPRKPKNKKKKYVKMNRAPEELQRLPSDPASVIRHTKKDRVQQLQVNGFDLDVEYALVSRQFNTITCFEYQWTDHITNQIYRIAINQQQLLLIGKEILPLTVPRSAEDRTFLTFSKERDNAVRARIGWESVQEKYALLNWTELPFEGVGIPLEQRVFFKYDEEEGEWVVSSHREKEEKNLDRMVLELIEDWQAGNLRHQGQVQYILINFPEEEFYFSFLKQVCCKDRPMIIKRVSLFSFLLAEKFNKASFLKAWLRSLKQLSDMEEELPYLPATLAKILQLLLQKQGSVHDYFHNGEEQEARNFMVRVFQIYHYYSKDEEALTLVKKKTKFKYLI